MNAEESNKRQPRTGFGIVSCMAGSALIANKHFRYHCIQECVNGAFTNTSHSIKEKHTIAHDAIHLELAKRHILTIDLFFDN